VHFHTTLAARTMSDIQLFVDTMVSNLVPADCYLRLDSERSSSVSVSKSCGDSLIQNVLGALAITIQDVQFMSDEIRFNIHNPFPTDQQAQLSLFDLLGRLLSTQNIDCLPGVTRVTVHNPSGNLLMFLRIETTGGPLLQRLTRVPSE